MPAPPIRFDAWPQGVNNIAKANRLPEGAVRGLVNFDPAADGILALRAGYSNVLPVAEGRALYAVGKYLVIVDGAVLRSYDTDTGDSIELGAIAADSSVAAAELNGVLYLNTPVDSVRTDGKSLKPWAVPAPGCHLEVIPGGTLSGRYWIALVAVGADGEESGADPVLLDVPEGCGIRISSADARPMRIYASVPNGATLFYQGLLYGGAVALTSIKDSQEYLGTEGLGPLPYCDELVAYHGVLVGRHDRYVFFTSPMYPHLTDPVRGFFQFPAPVSLLAATDGGVYVVADKTYFITELETPAPSRRTVLEMDAVAGSAVTLPDGRAAWFTRFGQAIGDAMGQVQLVNRSQFAPEIARKGAAGYLGHNGNEMVVTTMRGATDTNNLATGDFADLEIG
ncbi:hypothetical protein BVH03_21885 [Pseudomonas sp. PA15(2017)]|uniref:hypothetical protein n=1 Tax=Pseudomonas sp. PA15(2017) TaxID=1932111 RepID=UPI000968F5B2|nr:hypothetical protein [Pseudomonas sp. PA15(2017)]OLU22906.1 hypothetical protein BVH03_21885 [Pseudomonas sp. PA15(2017)]